MKHVKIKNVSTGKYLKQTKDGTGFTYGRTVFEVEIGSVNVHNATSRKAAVETKVQVNDDFGGVTLSATQFKSMSYKARVLLIRKLITLHQEVCEHDLSKK